VSLDSLPHLIRPAAGEPVGALVLFHGRGTSEHDLYPLLDALDPERRLVGATPRGPLVLQGTGGAGTAGTAPQGAAESAPLGGAHWYVVREIGFPDRPTFAAAYDAASAWLDAFAEETGVPPERTVLGGFSQGAVMSYALGLGRGRPRPAAIVPLSGFVPTVEGFELDLSSPPPAAIGHGVYDPVISVEWSRRAKAMLEDAGGEVLYRESPMPHSVDPTFIAELRPWLAETLEPARSGGGRAG
jgi:phospholipase/carboxylesterase